MGCCVFFLLYVMLSRSGDVLTGFGSGDELKGWQLQVALAGFCASGLPSQLMRNAKTEAGAPRGDFATNGDMLEAQYTKGSIYALLYAAYADAGMVLSDRGVPYEFTFNTWGVAPSPYPDDDPQRFGKAAYAGLATLAPVGEYRRAVGRHLHIIEIGSGTGAGANLIASSVLKGSKYIALDMQAQGTATCKRKHGYSGRNGHGNVTCVHCPRGVTAGSPILDVSGRRCEPPPPPVHASPSVVRMQRLLV